MEIFDILILIVIAAVVVTLGFGIYTLYRGGDFARSNSNKLMRLRIVLQATAVLLLIGGMWWKATHGG
ncbi:twin transmembrane helix small protein [Brevundimonas sp.]|uniref:twin transmembrane helix small protein n=1 Tax=Brevundimonas sp. TaxID=1871086 RepID=UPI003D6D309A